MGPGHWFPPPPPPFFPPPQLTFSANLGHSLSYTCCAVSTSGYFIVVLVRSLPGHRFYAFSSSSASAIANVKKWWLPLMQTLQPVPPIQQHFRSCFCRGLAAAYIAPACLQSVSRLVVHKRQPALTCQAHACLQRAGTPTRCRVCWRRWTAALIASSARATSPRLPTYNPPPPPPNPCCTRARANCSGTLLRHLLITYHYSTIQVCT